jgi:hypothetical protein
VVDPETIKHAEDFLAMLRTGEVTEFVTMGRLRDGSWWRVMSSSEHVFESASELLALGIRRLGFKVDENAVIAKG